MAKILVIDDDAMIRTTLSIALRQAGHEVLLAGNGHEAMSLMKGQGQNRPVELVVTDIIMPEADGVEVIMQCRKDYPLTPIIAMSGGGRIASMDFLDAAEKLGAAATLPKPFVPDILLLTIAHVLAQASAGGELAADP